MREVGKFINPSRFQLWDDHIQTPEKNQIGWEDEKKGLLCEGGAC